MTARGLGTAPIGSTPFGLGTSASGPVPPRRRILAPYIDPATGDCVVAEDGELEGMPVNRQRVMLTCLTRPGSSSVLPDWGVELPPKITESYPGEVRAEVLRAHRFMTSVGDITIEGVDTETTSAGRVQVLVSYTDMRTGESDRAISYG